MSYNGSGTFLINSAGQPVVANTVISATVFNALTSDLATGLSTAITKDGQTTITNNIPFGSNKITGLGSGTAAADAANLGQVQSTVAKLITVTGTDTITGSMSPQLTAYAAGQLFYFVANAANTGAVTLNIDSLGAKNITRDGSSALAAGDINSGEVVVVIYDGTRFQMINAANSFGNTTINGTLTVTGNAGFQANVSITSALSVGGVFAVTGAATFTANPTLSAGTASGVLYLNGSKVATSGSALTFDGTNLSATRGLKAASAGTVVSSFVDGLSVGGYDSIGFLASPGNALAVGGYRAAQWSAVEFYASGSLQATLNSTGLGIGTTSPSYKLHVLSGSSANTVFLNNTAGSAYSATSFFSGSMLTLQSGSNASGNATAIRFASGNNGSLEAMFGVAQNASTYADFVWQSYNGSYAERLRLDSAGNLGLGVTPSAWRSTNPAFQLGQAGSVFSYSNANNVGIAVNYYIDSAGNDKYITNGTGGAYWIGPSSGQHRWFIFPNNTSGAGAALTPTQAMTLDASGNLALGTTSAASLFHMAKGGGYAWQYMDSYGAGYHGVLDSRCSRNSTVGSFTATNSGDNLFLIRANGTNSGATAFAQGATITFQQSAAAGATYVPAIIAFGTSDGTNAVTERARITAGGFFKASNTGTYASSTDDRHELRSDKNDINVLVGTTSTGSSVVNVYSSFPASPNAGAYHFAAAISGSGYQFTVDADGDVKNTNGSYAAISDLKLKQDIEDAASQWDDIKSVRVRKYRFKRTPDAPLQIGVIAQELEQTSPGLVSEDADRDDENNELGTTTKSVKYSILYMKAIKALQEAMARIEQLEAKVAVLENK